MNLPVANRRTAISKVVFVNLFIAITIISLTISVNDFNFGHWFMLPPLLWGIVHIIKNNVHKAEIESETIRILINKRSITIPISEITSIDSASSRPDIFDGTFRITYFLTTQNKYSFGSTLLLGFISEKLHIEEPIEIKTIKSIIEHTKQ